MSNWLCIYDDPPPRSKELLLYADHGANRGTYWMGEYTHGRYDDVYDFRAVGVGTVTDITHWMPLPPPPPKVEDIEPELEWKGQTLSPPLHLSMNRSVGCSPVEFCDPDDYNPFENPETMRQAARMYAVGLLPLGGRTQPDIAAEKDEVNENKDLQNTTE